VLGLDALRVEERVRVHRMGGWVDGLMIDVLDICNLGYPQRTVAVLRLLSPTDTQNHRTTEPLESASDWRAQKGAKLQKILCLEIQIIHQDPKRKKSENEHYRRVQKWNLRSTYVPEEWACLIVI
jgi:hypothetical protein